MAKSNTSFRLFIACLGLVTACFTPGCELFVHFDRSRISEDDAAMVDGGGTDGGGTDGGSDAGMDANAPDTGADAGSDDAATDDANTNDANTNDANRPDTGADAGCVDPATDCPATGSECIVAICTGGTCDTMNLGNSHVLSTGQTANDCQSVVCDGAGSTETIADAADHPTSTTCDTVSCSGTTVTHTFANTTTACITGFCDGAGACVECNSPAQCPATGNECVAATCVTNTCGTMNLTSSHVLSTGQTPGDCQHIVCNGSGGMMSADDATDLPTSSSACLTSPACTGSPLAPSFTDAATGTPCTDSGGSVCGDTTGAASGMCVECNVDGDCTVGTCQTDHTCA